MFTAILVLLIIVCVLLVLVVLIQPSKGGASGPIAGGISSQIMGVQRSSDLMEKLTWGFAISIMVLTLSSSFFLIQNDDEDGINSVNVNKAQELPSVGGGPQNQQQSSEEE
ncbi:MAG: preprotein translocase subunit SecG [Cytophagales bacterium]